MAAGKVITGFSKPYVALYSKCCSQTAPGRYRLYLS